eukprot:ANDGO_00355.mRNA.1 Plasma membrane ATPase 1
MLSSDVIVDVHRNASPDLFDEANFTGLSSAQAQSLYARYGSNELPEKVDPVWAKLFRHLWGPALWKPKPIPLMMWLAIAVSGFIEDWVDFAVILALHLLNTIIAFYEEQKAGDAVAALKDSLAPRAMVCRDAKWDSVNARLLVPGDLIRLKIGEMCPADCQIIRGNQCQIDQSGLTGESRPVKKKVGDMAFGGTCIKAGEIDGIVRATGAQTEFGKTAALIAGVEQTGQFQRVINRIAMGLVAIALVINAIMVTVSLARKEPWGEVVQRSLVLIVASVPIALPMVCTTILAAGSRRLAEHNAVVTRLSAVEELASMTVLCSDKTGTLTLNELQMDDPWICPGNKASLQDITLFAAMSTVTVDPDPIDTAVRSAAMKAGYEHQLGSWKMLQFVPFDPSNRRTVAVLQASDDGRIVCVVKGAPGTVLYLCNNRAIVRESVEAKISEYAARGLRCLGVGISWLTSEQCSSVADGNIPSSWELQFIGLLSMFDPPRSDSAQVILKAKELGVSVKMISGDHHKICVETGRRLGLGTRILQSTRLRDTAAPVLCELVKESDGFSEVFPEDKYNIVASLQASGINCGMTGDGVNDAAALKKANVGFAVKGATPAARSAADVVLLSDGLSVIITAILRSRKIFQRVKNYCIYRINISLTLLFFFAVMIIVFDESLPAIIIVLMALLNDFTIMTISTDKVIPSATPDGWKFFEMLSVSVAMAFVSTILSILSYLSFRDGWFVEAPQSSEIETLIYMQIAIMNQITVFTARTQCNIFSRRPGTALLVAVLAQMLLTTLISLFWPFGAGLSAVSVASAIFIWMFTIVSVLIHDGVKLLIYHAFREKAEQAKIEDIQRNARLAGSALETDNT